ncbi:MAG: NUDIX domain-containing protein [Ruminococcus sp.]|nr:NUDIX domain-containing protein [Ruminococcus sp.]
MELLDLYTKDKVKTGKTVERHTKIPEGYYRLVVHVCIFDRSGKMLIQQRQTFKDGYAGVWDLTAGGAALSGDSSADAIERELEEEMGIRMDFSDKRPSVTIHFKTGFNEIYLVEADIPLSELRLQYEEVRDAKYATKEEILSMIKKGQFVPYHTGLIELLFFMKGRTGAIVGLD